jgi:hypothetical protein
MRRSRELDNTTPCRFRHVALEALMRAGACGFGGVVNWDVHTGLLPHRAGFRIIALRCFLTPL